MEMPEGLKRIFRTSQRLEPHYSSIRDADMDSILVLMKDMDEALKSIIEDAESIETKNASAEFWLSINQAMNIVSKFKEWK